MKIAREIAGGSFTMFLVDDILLAPVKGLAAVCRQIQEAAHQELKAEQKAAMAALAELHRRFESDQIDEEAFTVQEARLVKRLDDIDSTLNPDG
jgi:hypothetical protein